VKTRNGFLIHIGLVILSLQLISLPQTFAEEEVVETDRFGMRYTTVKHDPLVDLPDDMETYNVAPGVRVIEPQEQFISRRFQGLRGRIDQMEIHLNQQYQNIQKSVDQRVEKINEKMDARLEETEDLILIRLEEISERLERLEGIFFSFDDRE